MTGYYYGLNKSQRLKVSGLLEKRLRLKTPETYRHNYIDLTQLCHIFLVPFSFGLKDKKIKQKFHPCANIVHKNWTPHTLKRRS